MSTGLLGRKCLTRHVLLLLARSISAQTDQSMRASRACECARPTLARKFGPFTDATRHSMPWWSRPLKRFLIRPHRRQRYPRLSRVRCSRKSQQPCGPEGQRRGHPAQGLRLHVEQAALGGAVHADVRLLPVRIHRLLRAARGATDRSIRPRVTWKVSCPVNTASMQADSRHESPFRGFWPRHCVDDAQGLPLKRRCSTKRGAAPSRENQNLEVRSRAHQLRLAFGRHGAQPGRIRAKSSTNIGHLAPRRPWDRRSAWLRHCLWHRRSPWGRRCRSACHSPPYRRGPWGRRSRTGRRRSWDRRRRRPHRVLPDFDECQIWPHSANFGQHLTSFDPCWSTSRRMLSKPDQLSFAPLE